MTAVFDRLLRCRSASSWTIEHANRWWDEYGSELLPGSGLKRQSNQHKEACAETLSVTIDSARGMTIDAPPKSLLGQADTDVADETTEE